MTTSLHTGEDIGLGLALPGIATLRTLREGLRFCLRHLGVRITRAPT